MPSCPHEHRDAHWGDSYWHASEPLRVERRPRDEVGSHESLTTAFFISLVLELHLTASKESVLPKASCRAETLYKVRGSQAQQGSYMQAEVS